MTANSLINVPYYATFNINEEWFQVKGTSVSKCVTNLSYQYDLYINGSLTKEFMTGVNYENSTLQVVFTGYK
jgi:type IV secretory pathway VirB6-like protein